MPRQVRIEFPGAVYHVMARGDRREQIYHDDEDRRMFLSALGEACGRTGWRVHAWVLMGNHYHLVVETPEPNLVAGMSWLQNTFTRRFNVRHKLWGHVFGGRYRAVLVDREDADYFRILVDYVHLNPVRAGLVSAGAGVESFPWSSLWAAYLKPARMRAAWTEVPGGLQAHGLEDTAAGRRQYVALLQERANLEGAEAGRLLPEGQSLQATLRRGWYFGAEAFRERLLKLAAKVLKAGTRRRNYAAGSETREHSEVRARELVERGMRVCRLSREDLLSLPRGEERKALIALAVKRATTVPLDWIARELDMGARSTVSRELGVMGRLLPKSSKLRKLYASITESS